MKVEMRPFWIAWGLAVALIGAATAAAGWVISISASWPFLAMAAVRLGCVVLALLTFVAAFRLALLGTVSLKRVLAKNLAVLIALELDDLRLAAQERARALGDVAAAHSSHPHLPSSGALEIPSFFGDRDEIRKLLGKATEHSLEQLLVSLQSYNETVLQGAQERRAVGAEARHQAALQLQSRIGLVQDSVQQALRTITPFCRADA